MTSNNPEKIGRYQVLERVGRGGMGVLYRGMDPVLDREVAIKVMLVDFSEDAEEMRPRFYREARAAAKLQHRNIVTVFEFAEEGNTPYIVMEFLRGTSLAQRMSSPLHLSLDNKLDIIAQLCDALHYAHEQGVVHRDVKPANVFLLGDGSVKLLDFGIAKVTTSTLTRKGDVLGSASYMSPEQVAGSESVDGRSDIFSAGVVLYELLAGRRPFHAEAPTAIIMKILHEPPPSLDLLTPGLPAQLVAAVDRALAKKQEDRFATAGELARELQWIRRGLDVSEKGAGVLEETRFASPAEIRNFQDELKKTRPTVESSGAATASGRPKWVIPASAAAVVALGAVVAVLTWGRGHVPPNDAAPPATSAAAASGSAAPSPAKTTDSARSATGTAPSAASGAEVNSAATALKVDSDPPGAAISIDGRDTRQTTPASITLTGTGTHRLRLSKPGFASQDVRLAATDIRDGSVRYTLQPAEVPTVAVSITSTYPVEVWDASKSISSESEAHQLRVPAGTTIRVKSAQYLLDAAVKVEGKEFEYQAPPLGYITVLTKYETCNVKIGSRDLGFPPITRLPIVSGQHRVDIACANGPNPPSQIVTVTANGTGTARIQ